MDSIYDLTRKIAAAAGATPKRGDLRSTLLRKLLVAKGGTPKFSDNSVRLWREIAVASGFSINGETEYQVLFKLAPGAAPDDKEWDLLNKILLEGFATP